MSIRDKLLESKADPVRYCFTNKAILRRESTANQNAPGCYDLPTYEKGVHFSFSHSMEKKTSLFLPTEDALKMFIALRDSLRGVIAESSDGEKLILQVLAERDAWGLERFTDRKSHVAEDLGL